MEKTQAIELVRKTLTQPFEKERFNKFVRELLNRFDEGKAASMTVPDAFATHVRSCWRLGTYKSPDGELADILIVNTTEAYKLERTRTRLRDFVAHKLKRQDSYKEAGLVAFVSPDSSTWRFSYVRMEYESKRDPRTGKIVSEERLTPARRYSFLVGSSENSHTAQKQLVPLLQKTDQDPSLADIEQSFSVESVTKEFFREYARLFETTEAALADLVKRDATIRADFKSKNVSTIDFTKKLLGQIVFLYFIQKKGWLGVPKSGKWGDGPRNFFRQIAEKADVDRKNIFNDVLEHLFYKTLADDRGHEAWCKLFQCRIPFLNGGLFEPLAGYDWEKTEISLPNFIFTNRETSPKGDTGTGILDVFDRYNFTVNEAEPLEKEVAIDPEMLGKVFENLIEENRRKGLGAFYTPREIVHYMCQESLINYLDTGLNSSFNSKECRMVSREELQEWIHQSDQFAHYAAAIAAGTKGDHYPKPPESIRECAREIDDLLRDITVCDPAIGSGAFPVGMMTEIVRARTALTSYFNDITERTAYHFKRHAIQNSLYGVDIDAGAVEIAKLRLWLSLVVDEEDVQQIKPLPNLDYKIVVGNSLIGVEKNLFNHEQFKRLEELKPKFFNESDRKKKAQFKKQIEDLIHDLTNAREDFDFEIYFSEIFHRKNGFDSVVGNPPYLFITEIDAKQKAYFFENYTTSAYRFDIYGIFIEKSVTQLLRDGGNLSFIIPHTLLSNDSFEKLRRLLLEKTQLKKVIDIGPGAFENASNEVMIFVACKMTPQNNETIHVFTTTADSFPKPIKEFAIEQHLWSQNPKSSWLINLSTIDSQILTKMERAKHRFGDLCTINQGMRTGDNEKYLSANQKSGKWKPVVGGKDVGRYKPLPDGQYVYYEPSVIDAPRRPEIFESTEKLVIQEIRNITLPRRLIATYDCRKFYCLQSTNVINHKRGIIQPSIKCLLGLLNSTAVNFFFRSRFPGNNHIPSNQLALIPIPTVPTEQQNSVERLVEQILSAKQRDLEADVSILERKLDELVYALYGLTKEEINIIEQ